MAHVERVEHSRAGRAHDLEDAVEPRFIAVVGVWNFQIALGSAGEGRIDSVSMNRRFPDQFYYQAPDAAGRAAIWPVYIDRYKLTPAQLVGRPGDGNTLDAGWTGAEIRRVCRQAGRLRITVREAAQ